jgi:hypothetical protein
MLGSLKLEILILFSISSDSSSTTGSGYSSSSKFFNRIAKKRLRRMKFPKMTRETKNTIRIGPSDLT